jgi:hypothetical protein
VQVDAYVSCALEGQTYKTRVIKNSFLPEWRESVTVQVGKVAEVGELELSLFDWNTTQNDKLVGNVTLSTVQMLALLRGKSGKTIDKTLPLTLEGAPVVGHDGQNAQIVIRLRPFVRCSQKFSNSFEEQADTLNKELVGSRKQDPIGRAPHCKVAPTLSPQCASIMDDICRHSCFVHAQLWRLTPDQKELELRGEHFTTSCFAGGDKDAQGKLKAMLTLCEESHVDIGTLFQLPFHVQLLRYLP